MGGIVGDLGSLSSRDLIRLAQKGNREALDRLFERHRPILRRWAAGRLPGWARDLVDTDDIIQDTLVKAFRNVDRFVPRHDGALTAYLRQALQNRIRDEITRAQRRTAQGALEGRRRDLEPSPLEAAIGRELLERYERALESLDEESRELILARIEMEMSYDAIATARNKPSADAARMAVSRALVRLATEMDHA